MVTVRAPGGRVVRELESQYLDVREIERDTHTMEKG